MANEFTRKETVADYQTYAGQKDSQIDFSAEADKITTAVKKVATDRETKKKKIQTETDDILTQLAKAEAYSSQTVQQTVLMQANNIKRDVLQFYKDVKIGKRKLADYQAYMQTSRDSIIKSGIAAKHWEENFIEQEARQKLGEDGIKIASGTETYISLNVFGDNILKNSVPYSSPSGEQFLVTMNVDENGNKTMPDFDTERHKYKPYQMMNYWETYQDDGNKYDIASLVKKSNANIGTFITSNISGYTTSAGGGVVTTIEGAQQMDEYLKTTGGKTAFTALMEDTVAVVLSSDLSVVNALYQRPGLGKEKYIIAQTEKEFREKGGTDLSKFIRIVATDKPPTFPDLTEEQRNAAKKMVEREFLTQLGQSTKDTKGMPGTPASASRIQGSQIAEKEKNLAIDLTDTLHDVITATSPKQILTAIQRLPSFSSTIQGSKEITQTINGEEVVTGVNIIYNDGSNPRKISFGVINKDGDFEQTPVSELIRTMYGYFSPSGGVGAKDALNYWKETNQINETYNPTTGQRNTGQSEYRGPSNILTPVGENLISLTELAKNADNGPEVQAMVQIYKDKLRNDYDMPDDLFTIEVDNTGGTNDRVTIYDKEGAQVWSGEKDVTNGANTLAALDKLFREWQKSKGAESTTKRTVKEIMEQDGVNEAQAVKIFNAK